MTHDSVRPIGDERVSFAQGELEREILAKATVANEAYEHSNDHTDHAETEGWCDVDGGGGLTW